MKTMIPEIRIDHSKPLAEDSGTGHNRWHPDIPPVVWCDPGDEVILETRDAFDGQMGRDISLDDVAAVNLDRRRPGQALLRNGAGVPARRRLLGPRRRFPVRADDPPGSPCSIIFGEGITSATPGSLDSLVLVVDDIEKARAELTDRGVDVSEVFRDAGGVCYHRGTVARVPGPDPQHRTYSSFASFSDPDGNVWVLQEITERLPGRV